MQRMTRLDGLRGLLAMYVMLGHVAPFVPLPRLIDAVLHHGEAAVDLFFCLSGMVVIQSLERFEFRAWPFLRARARRTLPVYFLVLAVAIFLLAGSPLPAMTWLPADAPGSSFWGTPTGLGWHILAHLALIQGMIPQNLLPWVWITVLPPAWSLSTEWQFYLVAAWFRVRNFSVLALLLLAIAVVYRLLPSAGFSKAFLPDAAGYFALGVASVGVLRGEARVFAVVFAGVFLLGLCSSVPSKAVTPVIWGVVLLAQMRPGWVLARALDWRVMRALGAISYPLYLVNEPVQRGCAMLVAPFAHGDVEVFEAVWLPLAVVMPVVVAVVMHRLVERPFSRRLSVVRYQSVAD